MTSKLAELGYDGSDIHRFYKFFLIASIVIKDPSDSVESRKAESIREVGNQKANALIVGGHKYYIDQAIMYGSIGLDYTEIKFKTLEDENKSKG